MEIIIVVYYYLSWTSAHTALSGRINSAVLPGNILACCILANVLSLAVIGPVIQTTVILFLSAKTNLESLECSNTNLFPVSFALTSNSGIVSLINSSMSKISNL